MDLKSGAFSLPDIVSIRLNETDLRTYGMHFDERMEAVLSSGHMCYFVVDYQKRLISNIKCNIKFVLGLESRTISFEKIAELIHPDDLSFVRQAETAIRDYYKQNISRKNIGNYKAGYCVRLKTLAGNYQLFQHQSVVLSVDDFGNCVQAFNILTNISNISPSNNYKVTLLDLRGNNSYVELDIFAQKQVIALMPLFTKREIEIIRLMSHGLKSPEIAKRLFISLHTVKNHRKNILHKSQIHSSSELIARCLHQGLI